MVIIEGKRLEQAVKQFMTAYAQAMIENTRYGYHKKVNVSSRQWNTYQMRARENSNLKIE